MRRFLERFLTPIGLAALLLFALQSRSDAISGSCTTYRTWNTGDTLTAPDLTTSFQQVATTNDNGACLAGHSPDVATMQTATDPYASATESLATSNDGELERIRFILQRMNGATSWYKENQFSGERAGRLTFVSTTQVKFCPFNGNLFRIPSTGKLYQIPSACTTAANTNVYVGGVAAQNLAASTVYWMYLFDLSGALTADFWAASTHAVDATTGIEIRTGDNTRVLIGMVRTNGASQFENDATNSGQSSIQGVLSYFNRRSIGQSTNLSANRTRNAATMAELNSEIRNTFLVWADESVNVATGGVVLVGNASTFASTQVELDGTTDPPQSWSYMFHPTAGQGVSQNVVFTYTGLSEGGHYFTVFGACSAGTCTWQGGTPAVGATYPYSLSIQTRG